MKEDKKIALVTGITGQDGSYLSELLLSKGYMVHGIALPDDDASYLNDAVNRYKGKIIIHRFSLMDYKTLMSALKKIRPYECYHLAALSFISFDPGDESDILTNNIMATHNLLRALHLSFPECRFFNAGTSEMFGYIDCEPQNENTPFRPRNAYGISKLAGHHLVEYYRKEKGLQACTGILYNHESPRRGAKFVTRKISQGAVKIKLGLQKKLFLGNLDAQRDWGHAADYVLAMYQILQKTPNEDYVIASGELHSVREFAEIAFSKVGLDYHKYVEVDPKFYREDEKVKLRGDISKIKKRIGWRPERKFVDIVTEMVLHDIELAEKIDAGTQLN